MRINRNKMELIKQLNENWNTQMDDETFERLVKYAVEDVSKSDEPAEEVVWNLIDNVPGFEQAEDAAELFSRVMTEVRKRL